MIIRMRLKRIAQADFRKSEATNFNELPIAVRKNLKPGEVVMLVSGGGDQLVFVYPPTYTSNARSNDCTMLASVRLRLKGSTWSPLMIVDYAKSVGIELIGLEDFARRFQRIIDQRIHKD